MPREPAKRHCAEWKEGPKPRGSGVGRGHGGGASSNTWIAALKAFGYMRKGGPFVPLPRKGTPEYDAVKEYQDRINFMSALHGEDIRG